MKHNPFLRFATLAVLIFAALSPTQAQTDQELGEATIKALLLFRAQQYIAAIPYFEIVVKAIPDEPNSRFMYGWCLLVKSKQTKNADEAKRLSARSLEQLTEAKRLGAGNPELDGLIDLLSGKATAAPDSPAFSLNKEADGLMVEGENLFAQSEYDKAIKKFEKALELDPSIYQAAISAGDSYTARGKWAKAEEWYQRAIKINPNRETAYRYSGTPLMKQNKYDAALERYIEAYITEPYNSMSRRGISQWADATGAKLAHPVIEPPAVSFGSNGKAAARSEIAAEDASMRPWLAYLAVREAWKKEKFARNNPKETGYRRSLPEEVEALRSAVAAAKEQKARNKDIELVEKMDGEGVLEAFVLLSHSNDEIAKDHPEYLKNNRPKLRQYVANYIVRK
jgi:tetratricopeptide (TPR) repeat protein